MLRTKLLLIILTVGVSFLAVSCSSNTNIPANSNAPIATATATPKPTPHPAAQNALKALRKMAGATEMGINKQEYSSRMIDLKADVEEQLAQLPEGELKKELKSALEAYIDAKSLWGTFDEFVIPFIEPADKILPKYNIPGRKKNDAPRLSLVLSVIWKEADRHIERAEQLLSQ